MDGFKSRHQRPREEGCYRMNAPHTHVYIGGRSTQQEHLPVITLEIRNRQGEANKKDLM